MARKKQHRAVLIMQSFEELTPDERGVLMALMLAKLNPEKSTPRKRKATAVDKETV